MPPKKKEIKGKDAKEVVQAPRVSKGAATPALLRGMKDILPGEQKYWDAVRGKGAILALAYSYDRIDTPILEDTKLFVRAVGKYTDIVEKEMFSFLDQGDDS